MVKVISNKSEEHEEESQQPLDPIMIKLQDGKEVEVPAFIPKQEKWKRRFSYLQMTPFHQVEVGGQKPVFDFNTKLAIN